MSDHYDLLIRGALVVDGTGRPGFEGSVGVRGERIAAIGDLLSDADMVIDSAGLAVCPGLVDTHSHADMSILRYPLAENLIMQGITTFLGGNCGGCPAPLKDPEAVQRAVNAAGIDVAVNWHTFGEWLQRVEGTGISPNYAPLVGHISLRNYVMGEDFKRRATQSETEAMQALVDDAMRAGAFGLSSDLDPDPGEYAHADELVALARVAQRYDGLYTPHTRHHENSWWADSAEEYSYGLMHSPKGEIITGRYHGLMEAVEIARLAGRIRLLLGHFMPTYILPQPQPRYLQEAAARATLEEIIDKPRSEGQEVFFNVIACSGSVGSESRIIAAFSNPALAIPEWLKRMSREEIASRLGERAFRDALLAVIQSGKFKFGMIHPITDPYWMDCFQVLHHRNPVYRGKTIGELARKREPKHIIDAVYSASFEALFDLVAEDPAATWAVILDKRENPGALPVFLKHPAGMPCTDCEALAGQRPADASEIYFRMAYGLFPYYLRSFVREQGVLTLEEAVHKASFVPAQQVLKLTDRGVLRPGAFADMVLFDPDTISDSGTFENPSRPPTGIEAVLVNGQVAWRHGAHTGATPGKVLRRPGAL